MSEAPSCYSHLSPKAKKEHRCCECRGVIRVGEVYHKHMGVWDGQGATFKMCDECNDLFSRLNRENNGNYDELIAFEQLYEAAFEGRDLDVMFEFMAIMIYRDYEPPDWMHRAITEAADRRRDEESKEVESEAF